MDNQAALDAYMAVIDDPTEEKIQAYLEAKKDSEAITLEGYGWEFVIKADTVQVSCVQLPTEVFVNRDELTDDYVKGHLENKLLDGGASEQDVIKNHKIYDAGREVLRHAARMKGIL